MIVSKPKGNTIFALAVFLILIFGSFFALLSGLLSGGTYFFFKLILAPVVLAVGLVVLSKFLASFKIVKLGNGQIEVFYPISKMRSKIFVKDILGWHEEAINTKNGEFREVRILYAKKKILKLSNKENTKYDAVVKYLKKKVKVGKYGK